VTKIIQFITEIIIFAYFHLLKLIFPNIDKGHDYSKNNLLPDFRIVCLVLYLSRSHTYSFCDNFIVHDPVDVYSSSLFASRK